MCSHLYDRFNDNTRQWLHIDDVVLLDSTWFLGERYRYRREKSMNRYIVDNGGHRQLLTITYIVASGLSMKLFPVDHNRVQWPTMAPLKITIASHGRWNPIMFVSREIELRRE